MNRILTLLFLYTSFPVLAQFETEYEKSGKTKTVTYEQGIGFYKKLAQKFPQIRITEKGLTDSGKPLHLILYSGNKNFDI